MNIANDEQKNLEWLLTNERGSYAFGTPSRLPQRKYHGLLISRLENANDPFHILSEINEKIILGEKQFELGSFSYKDLKHPKGFEFLQSFTPHPYPTWEYRCDETLIVRQLSVDRLQDLIQLTYSFSNVPQDSKIFLFPYFTLRNAHRLIHENIFLDGQPRVEQGMTYFNFYQNTPKISVETSSKLVFSKNGFWNSGVFYSEEEKRGYESIEDLYCPGFFQAPIEEKTDIFVKIGLFDEPENKILSIQTIRNAHNHFRNSSSFVSRLKKASRDYLIQKRSERSSIVAGYPWFGEWGRDTFISLPGLTMAQAKFKEAKDIILSYKSCLKDGLVPNVLGSNSQTSDPYSVDATLWCIHAIQKLEEFSGIRWVESLQGLVLNLLENIQNHSSGNIKIADSGLLWADAGCRPLTWMDAQIEGQPVTARSPFAVEVNALFYNAVCYALKIAKRTNNPSFVETFKPIRDRLKKSFREYFWIEDKKYLADYHDGEHRDTSLRPNQLIALSVPFSPVTKKMGRFVLNRVKKHLLTPYGLRTLSPDDPKYQGQCEGTQRQRDLAYHQGTVWPWLVGPYMDAILSLYGPKEYLKEFSEFEKSFADHLDQACLGQISEIFDGDLPHSPRGAPAQAWSVAEVLRVALKAQEIKSQGSIRPKRELPQENICLFP